MVSCSILFYKNVLVCEICTPKSPAVGKRPSRWGQDRRVCGDGQGTLPLMTAASETLNLRGSRARIVVTFVTLVYVALSPGLWLHLYSCVCAPLFTMTFIDKTLSCNSALLGSPRACQIQRQKGNTKWAGHIQCVLEDFQNTHGWWFCFFWGWVVAVWFCLLFAFVLL